MSKSRGLQLHTEDEERNLLFCRGHLMMSNTLNPPVSSSLHRSLLQMLNTHAQNVPTVGKPNYILVCFRSLHDTDKSQPVLLKQWLRISSCQKLFHAGPKPKQIAFICLFVCLSFVAAVVVAKRTSRRTQFLELAQYV